MGVLKGILGIGVLQTLKELIGNGRVDMYGDRLNQAVRERGDGQFFEALESIVVEKEWFDKSGDLESLRARETNQKIKI